jgi:hypothetical protein
MKSYTTKLVLENIKYLYPRQREIMSDRFTEVTTQGWGSRLLGSIRGVFIGFLIFIASFVVLYWNEGRLDISKIAQTAIEINPIENASVEGDKQFVSTTGTLESAEKIGDDLLKKGSYIATNRSIEMYSWVEEKNTKSRKNFGGSETTETIYTYKKQWARNPMSSSNFRKPEGHLNPQMKIRQNSSMVKKAKLGIYNIDMNRITLPEHKNIQLSKENIILNNDIKLASDKYLFTGKGTIDDPEIGDCRISYSAVYNPTDPATIFGKLDIKNQSISPCYLEKNTMFYRIFQGTRDDAISTMQSEYKIITWILRIIGFLLMWTGLMALFSPISVFLDILPIFWSISSIGIGFMTFIISITLSIITILLSIVLHNLMALLITIFAIIICMISYLRNRRKKQTSKSTSSDLGQSESP